MSALARYFHAAGKKVAGYDKTPSQITKSLEELGIVISYQDTSEAIPAEFKVLDKTLVVYTPAVPSKHTEFQFYQSGGFNLKKRSEVLGIITRDSFCLARSTHSKYNNIFE